MTARTRQSHRLSQRRLLALLELAAVAVLVGLLIAISMTTYSRVHIQRAETAEVFWDAQIKRLEIGFNIARFGGLPDRINAAPQVVFGPASEQSVAPAQMEVTSDLEAGRRNVEDRLAGNQVEEPAPVEEAQPAAESEPASPTESKGDKPVYGGLSADNFSLNQSQSYVAEKYVDGENFHVVGGSMFYTTDALERISVQTKNLLVPVIGLTLHANGREKFASIWYSCRRPTAQSFGPDFTSPEISAIVGRCY